MVSHTTTFLLEERRVAFKVESLAQIQIDKFGWTFNDAVFLCMSELPFLAKIQNRTNKKSGMEILLLSKFFGHVIKNLDGSGFSHPSFWSCDQKLGW